MNNSPDVQEKLLQPVFTEEKEFRNKGYWNYQILGDDIAIWDDNVYHYYMKILRLLGIKVAMSKSFISNKVCEFAKVFVTKDTIFKPMSSSVVSNLYGSDDKNNLVQSRVFLEILNYLKFVP